MNRLALLAALALSATGCISKHNGGEFDPSQFKVGVTTRREVVAKWGNPDRVRPNEWTWISGDLLGSKVKCAYMMIGITIANSGLSTREARLTFDKNGRLASIQTVQSMPDGVDWNPIPW